jgi:hypothetical protein
MNRKMSFEIAFLLSPPRNYVSLLLPLLFAASPSRNSRSLTVFYIDGLTVLYFMLRKGKRYSFCVIGSEGYLWLILGLGGLVVGIETIDDGQTDSLELEVILPSLLEAIIDYGLVEEVEGLVGGAFLALLQPQVLLRRLLDLAAKV